MAEKERENRGMKQRRGGSKWLKGKGERREEEGVWGDAATVRLKP